MKYISILISVIFYLMDNINHTTSNVECLAIV